MSDFLKKKLLNTEHLELSIRISSKHLYCKNLLALAKVYQRTDVLFCYLLPITYSIHMYEQVNTLHYFIFKNECKYPCFNYL